MFGAQTTEVQNQERKSSDMSDQAASGLQSLANRPEVLSKLNEL